MLCSHRTNFVVSETDAVIARDAANRWTDSLFTLKSYFSSNFNVSERCATCHYSPASHITASPLLSLSLFVVCSDFHAQFEVPEELDYLS